MAAAQVISLPAFGATPEDWAHFTLLLGLTADLLPVVSNPNAEISPDSKLRDIGKTPSRYNGERKVAGIANWTSHQTKESDIDRWSRQRDYGICVQTRTVRALDVDISDPELARQVAYEIREHLGGLPARRRSNANKFLVAFTLPGDFAKRIIKTEHGAIEFLATGQQFVAIGTHPSGVRYEWEGGLPDEFPTVSPEAFEKLWRVLAKRFAVETPIESKASTKAEKLADAITNDPTAKALYEKGMVISAERDGRLHITCPFEDEHTTESSESATTYFPANTGGYALGHFKCLHAHCAHRSDEEFRQALGIVEDDFDVLTDDPEAAADTAKVERFKVVPLADFMAVTPMEWMVKGVLPRAALAVVFGDSGSGKTFFMLDIAGAVAQGKEWRGRRVRQGRVVYIVAEGAAGFRNRAKAYAHQQGIDPKNLEIGVIGDAPNLLQPADVKALLSAVKDYGTVDVIVVDTLAQTMPGGNENSGEDVGRALAHCRALHKATGALIVLVHHSGKDATRGARGWSGLRAAADVEIEILRADNDRVATVTKLKDGGEEGSEFGFRLNTVVVGLDDDGDDITSCVIEHCDAVPKAQRKTEPKGSNERLVLRMVSEMSGLSGEGIGAHELISACVDQMVPPEEGKRDRRREVVMRAVDSLVANGQLVMDGSKLKIAGEE